jgi:hypothetical protein
MVASIITTPWTRADGTDVLGLGRLFNIAADANRLARWRGRRRRSLRNAANDAAGNATGDTALDARHCLLETGFDSCFGFDF